jgi:hypothetical protein
MNEPTNSSTPAKTLEQFEQQAQAVLRDSVEHLDGHTLSRLTQARHAALDAAKNRSQWSNWKVLAPLSATAAAMVLAITLALNPASRTQQDAASTTLLANSMINGTTDALDSNLPDKLEIIASEDSLEFYRDVDFYAWLESELDDNVDAVPTEQSTIHEHSEA